MSAVYALKEGTIGVATEERTTTSGPPIGVKLHLLSLENPFRSQMRTRTTILTSCNITALGKELGIRTDRVLVTPGFTDIRAYATSGAYSER